MSRRTTERPTSTARRVLIVGICLFNIHWLFKNTRVLELTGYVVADKGSSNQTRPIFDSVDKHVDRVVAGPYTIPPTADTSIRTYLEKITAGDNQSLAVCTPTSQLRLVLVQKEQDENSTKRWILETFDEHGQRKNIGGDEFYISYLDHTEYTPSDFINNPPHPLSASARPSAVAIATDNQDGTHSLDFIRPLMTANQLGGALFGFCHWRQLTFAS